MALSVIKGTLVVLSLRFGV